MAMSEQEKLAQMLIVKEMEKQRKQKENRKVLLGCLAVGMVIFLMLFASCMSSCGHDDPEEKSAPLVQKNGLTRDEENTARAYVKMILAEQMHDPDSAEFRDVSAMRRNLVASDEETNKDIIQVVGKAKGTNLFGAKVEQPFEVVLTYPKGVPLIIRVGGEERYNVLNEKFEQSSEQKEW